MNIRSYSVGFCGICHRSGIKLKCIDLSVPLFRWLFPRVSQILLTAVCHIECISKRFHWNCIPEFFGAVVLGDGCSLIPVDFMIIYCLAAGFLIVICESDVISYIRSALHTNQISSIILLGNNYVFKSIDTSGFATYGNIDGMSAGFCISLVRNIFFSGVFYLTCAEYVCIRSG